MADVVFVGRSLLDLGDRQHGSDMIEPAALGKPVIVGPFTANFADAMRQFVASDAMLVVQDAHALEESVAGCWRILTRPRRSRRGPPRSSSASRAPPTGTLRSFLTR